jgi:hypothetical protein
MARFSDWFVRQPRLGAQQPAAGASAQFHAAEGRREPRSDAVAALAHHSFRACPGPWAAMLVTGCCGCSSGSGESITCATSRPACCSRRTPSRVRSGSASSSRGPRARSSRVGREFVRKPGVRCASSGRPLVSSEMQQSRPALLLVVRPEQVYATWETSSDGVATLVEDSVTACEQSAELHPEMSLLLRRGDIGHLEAR